MFIDFNVGISFKMKQMCNVQEPICYRSYQPCTESVRLRLVCRWDKTWTLLHEIKRGHYCNHTASQSVVFVLGTRAWLLKKSWKQRRINIMRFAHFWDTKQRWVVVLYRRFGTIYRCHLQGSRSARIFWPLKMRPICCPETSIQNYHSTLRNELLGPWRWDRQVVQKRRYRTTTIRCVMTLTLENGTEMSRNVDTELPLNTA
jgi:hypothetical protein